MEVDSQYLAEKVYLDNKIKTVNGDPELLTIMNEQLLLLRSKEIKLSTSIIDRLKDGLQQKYDEEDAINTQLCGFPNDDPDLTAPELCRIEAVLSDSYYPPSHCKISDFLDVSISRIWCLIQLITPLQSIIGLFSSTVACRTSNKLL